MKNPKIRDVKLFLPCFFKLNLFDCYYFAEKRKIITLNEKKTVFPQNKKVGKS